MPSRGRPFLTVVFTVFCLGAGAVASAEPSDVNEPADAEGEQQDEIDLEELRRQLDILAEEVERLRSGEQPIELTDEDARTLGLAPSAAATYERGNGVSIAGYGEMLFENFAGENEAGQPTGSTSQFDFLRAILYAGYRFNDKFLFNSEIEVEHADEVFVEFAYVDYLAHENFGVRGGMLLVPMGLVNEFHEPNVFLGAERPVTEQRIIPSTWRENGGGIHGSVDRVAFRAYVINGLDGSGFSFERYSRRAPEGLEGQGEQHGLHRASRRHAGARCLRGCERIYRRLRSGAKSLWMTASSTCRPPSSTCTDRHRFVGSICGSSMHARVSATRRS